MAIEIERKFLIDKMKLKDELKNFIMGTSDLIIQHYIPSAPNQTIRIRKYTDDYIWYEMCIKFCKSNMERDKIEFKIELEKAEELISHSIGSVIKTRYKIISKKYPNEKWDVDIYVDPKGVCVAEIELESADQEVELPDWIIREVTNEPGYSNYELATRERKDG